MTNINEQCNIGNCQYNNSKYGCLYCGDYWELNSKECHAFVSEYGTPDEPMTKEELERSSQTEV